MRGRVLAAWLCATFLLAGCTSGSGDPRPPGAEKPPLGVPRHVQIPKVKTALNVDQVTPCLDKRQVVGPIYTALGPVAYAASQVESTRELDFTIPTNVDLPDDKQFQRLYSDQPPTRRSEDFVTRRVAWALGITPHGLDADYFLRGEGSSLIAGYYDPTDGHIVVRSDGTFDDELVTLTHELTHAATDELFGFSADTRGRMIDDLALAENAVIEGDATLVAARYLSRVAAAEPMHRFIEASLGSRAYKNQRDAGVPHVVLENFSWPYQWGLAFVCKIYRERGWTGVNRLYEHPVDDSAEIMFPDRYLNGEKPETPPALGELGAPWARSAQAQLGAAHLKALFEAPGDVEGRALSDPLGRAAAWNGGGYELWVDSDTQDAALGVALVEHRGFHNVLCESMHNWYRAAFFDAKADVVARYTVAYDDEDQSAFISCSGRQIRIGIGPDPDTARAVSGYE
ncbi:MAG: hypothetical protein QOG54_1016 [Actinomycetota bacterium]|jgi:hypothetical protein|nr:hypothetical protein [Actinomycetota bacterium]